MQQFDSAGSESCRTCDEILTYRHLVWELRRGEVSVCIYLTYGNSVRDYKR